jgi:hypothetical protein
MMQVISVILALAKAAPIIDKWLGLLFVAYQEQKKKEIQEANKKAIDEGIKNQDQRPIESDQISGKPSGMGTVRDSIPGVWLRDQGKD